MKRTLASVAAAGLLTFGLAACGEDADTESSTPDDGPAATEDAPAGGEESTQPPAAGDGEETGAPVPGDGEQTSAAPDPEAQEFCATVAELTAEVGADPQQQVDLILDLREVAPDEIRPDLDVIAEEFEGLTPEELEATAAPDGVDVDALQEANDNLGVYLGENCGPAL